MKNNSNSSKGIKESYAYYKTRVEKPISDSYYRKLTADFNTFLMKQVLLGHEIILPSRMGRISVLGYLQEIKLDDKGNIIGARIDWKGTKDLWDKNPEAKKVKQLVYFFNEHSDGIKYTFRWMRNRVLVTNKNYYTFVPSRHNKRLLAKLIKSGAEYLIK